MWRSYKTVKTLLRKLPVPDLLGQWPANAQDICNLISQQLERQQQYFDKSSDSFKKSVCGRSLARMLYKLYAGVDQVENHLRLLSRD
jgi:predicted transcriptional regulator